MESSIDVVTFGMFIIDEIDYINGYSKKELIGGAGTYVAVGARLVAGRANAKKISFIVDKGSDFPEAFANTIDSWETSVVYRTDQSRLTTRAWNGYGSGDHRDFKYLTSKLRLDENSLSPAQVLSQSFHMVCSSERCIALVKGIDRRRNKYDRHTSSRRIVFEPIPDLCVPSELASLKSAMSLVDIISPNAEELAGFFRDDRNIKTQPEMADWALTSGIGVNGGGALIVREGSKGATVYTRKWSGHIPAYHTTSSTQVEDPTGGGNAFLGGLMMAMSHKVEPNMMEIEDLLEISVALRPLGSTASDLLWAAIYASIAASFVIEQAGMPTLSVSTGMKEMWNGDHFERRLREFVAREKRHITQSLQLR